MSPKDVPFLCKNSAKSRVVFIVNFFVFLSLFFIIHSAPFRFLNLMEHIAASPFFPTKNFLLKGSEVSILGFILHHLTLARVVRIMNGKDFFSLSNSLAFPLPKRTQKEKTHKKNLIDITTFELAQIEKVIALNSQN